LERQDSPPEQIIVVDGSADDISRAVALGFSHVQYYRNPLGYGHMTYSRNIGLKAARGEIVSFLDDDAFAHSGWSRELVKTYALSADIAGVGGRALNKIAGEASRGLDQIGKLLPNGRLTGNFAADTGEIKDVDHIIGCNMSFRRSVLARLGGLREEYPGTEVREETDICLRVKAIGGRLVYNPAVVVDHLGAGQSKGKRFDLRYEFYAKRNHVYLLLRNFGPGGSIFLRNLPVSLAEITGEFGYKIAAALARFLFAVAGTAAGFAAGFLAWLKFGKGPVRQDDEGREITDLLSGARKQPSAGETAEEAEDIGDVMREVPR
jgi:GT2 family glycosyltransferase